MSWWCVGWSDELKDKPVAVRAGAEDLVLFRNLEGMVQACEDRCAHRRVPLSMGWVTAKGTLQCGYHGWAYEGGTGQCVEIPNFRPDEPISPRVKGRAFPAHEGSGAIFVRVDSLAAEDVPETPHLNGIPAHSAGSGQVELAIPHMQWVEALMSDPCAALGLPFHLTGERAQQDSGDGSMLVRFQARERQSPAPLAVRLEVWPETGFSHLVILDATGADRLNALISSTPLDAGCTLVRWRCASNKAPSGASAVLRKIFKHAEGPIRIEQDAVTRIAAAPAEAVQIWRSLAPQSSSPMAQIRTVEER